MQDADIDKIGSFKQDFSSGFVPWLDSIIRGKDKYSSIFISSLALASLEIGLPDDEKRYNPIYGLINTNQFLSPSFINMSSEHPLFNFDDEKFVLFGTNFTEYFGELNHIFFDGPEVQPHLTPFYQESVASELNLPDFPYGETAHVMHLVTAFYDTGRTFQDLWNDPELKHNVVKIATHPHMVGAGIEHGVMLGVMGLLHPLGPLIAIGVAHLASGVVHTARLLAEGNKETIAKIDELPLLGEIFRISGLEAWAMSQKPIMGHHSHKIITSREQGSQEFAKDI